MANTFRVVTKSGVATDSSSPTSLYTVPASTTSVVLALLLTNKHSQSIKATLVLDSDTTVPGASANVSVNILKDISISEESALELLAGQKYVLGTTDILKIYADNANLDVTFSFMEIT